MVRLADAWLAGWDAGELKKPESACPFRYVEGNTIANHSFADLWTRGWKAGCRRGTRDRRAKQHFIALSLGMKEASPDDRPACP